MATNATPSWIRGFLQSGRRLLPTAQCLRNPLNPSTRGIVLFMDVIVFLTSPPISCHRCLFPWRILFYFDVCFFFQSPLMSFRTPKTVVYRDNAGKILNFTLIDWAMDHQPLCRLPESLWRWKVGRSKERLKQRRDKLLYDNEVLKNPRFGCIIFWRLELQSCNEELWDIVQNFTT